MERRLDKLEAAFGPAQLREIVAEVAAERDIDPEELLRESQAILSRCAGLSLPEIAAQEGIDLAELEAAMKAIA